MKKITRIFLIVFTLSSLSIGFAGQPEQKRKPATLSKEKVEAKAPEIKVSESKFFGIGPLIGEPIGASLKYWLKNEPFAIGGFLGMDFSESAFALFADGLYHFKNVAEIVFPWDHGELSLYTGLGVKVSFPSKGTRVVLRIPLGINGLYGGNDWDFFAELVPGIRVSPSVGGNLDAGLGVRYYF